LYDELVGVGHSVKQFVAFVACSVALLACAQQQQQGYWLKPGASQEEFSADFLACTEQSKHPSSHASVDQKRRNRLDRRMYERARVVFGVSH
jgi:hypothetical protein